MERHGPSQNFDVGAESGSRATRNQYLLFEIFMPRNYVPDHFSDSGGASYSVCSKVQSRTVFKF